MPTQLLVTSKRIFAVDHFLWVLIFSCLSYNVHSRNYLSSREVVVVAGNFSLDGQLMNIAEYDVETGEWSTQHLAQLYLYGQSNGVVWDFAVNKTDPYFNKLFVVGTFDTVSESSQIQYCSVGEWDGIYFGKVGEGLCPRGIDSSTTISIQSMVMGNNGDLFVGGTFESRVWDGKVKHFVQVFDVAHFDAVKAAWLPLLGGRLRHTVGVVEENPMVSTLAWDSSKNTLFIGGFFNSIDDKPISPGLAVWSEENGMLAFPGGGLTHSQIGTDGKATAIAFEPKSQSLFVAGEFHEVGDTDCEIIAVWNRASNKWRCLYEPQRAISTVTSLFLDIDRLYVAGWASVQSDWRVSGGAFPYSISRLDIAGYISSRRIWDDDDASEGSTATGGDSSSDDVVVVQETARKLVHYRGARARQLRAQQLKRQRRKGHMQPAEESKAHQRKQLTMAYERARERRRLTSSGHFRRNASVKSVALERGGSSINNSYPLSSLAAQLPAPASLLVSPSSVHQSPSSRPSSIPSSSPSVPPRPILDTWEPQWEWLPGYMGANGPILKMSRGQSALRNALFIVGAFNNDEALVIWREDAINGSHQIPLGKRHSLFGLLTSVAQLRMPYEQPADTPTPAPTTITFKNSTLINFVFVSLTSVLLGIMLSAFAFYMGWIRQCLSREDTDAANNSEQAVPTITLHDLSDPYSSGIDFRDCFDRAMKARHLPTHESLLIINSKEIELSKIIGEGSFGRVWRGQWRNNAVAVKEFVFAQTAIKGGSIETHKIVEEIVGEAGLMACLRHPKILQLYGCSLTMNAIWIVSELCRRGSLRMVLNDARLDLSLLTKVSICIDVADGMVYLHTRKPPIIHRDLKSHNIFITEMQPGRLVAKIGDWGSARAVALTGAKSMTHGVGTACWIAPEVINYAHFSKDSDVYAFGIVLWEVFTRLEVYDGLSGPQIIAKVANYGLRPRVPHDCPWKGIMTDCWRQNPSERPAFSKIIQVLSKIYSDKKAEARAHAQAGSSAAATGKPKDFLNLGEEQSPAKNAVMVKKNGYSAENTKMGTQEQQQPVDRAEAPTREEQIKSLRRDQMELNAAVSLKAGGAAAKLAAGAAAAAAAAPTGSAVGAGAGAGGAAKGVAAGGAASKTPAVFADATQQQAALTDAAATKDSLDIFSFIKERATEYFESLRDPDDVPKTGKKMPPQLGEEGPVGQVDQYLIPKRRPLSRSSSEPTTAAINNRMASSATQSQPRLAVPVPVEPTRPYSPDDFQLSALIKTPGSSVGDYLDRQLQGHMDDSTHSFDEHMPFLHPSYLSDSATDASPTASPAESPRRRLASGDSALLLRSVLSNSHDSGSLLRSVDSLSAASDDGDGSGDATGDESSAAPRAAGHGIIAPRRAAGFADALDPPISTAMRSSRLSPDGSGSSSSGGGGGKVGGGEESARGMYGAEAEALVGSDEPGVISLASTPVLYSNSGAAISSLFMRGESAALKAKQGSDVAAISTAEGSGGGGGGVLKGLPQSRLAQQPEDPEAGGYDTT